MLRVYQSKIQYSVRGFALISLYSLHATENSRLDLGNGSPLLGRIAVPKIRCGLLLSMFRGLCCVCVCLSVSHNREPTKTDEWIEVPFEIWTRVGQRNHVL